MEGMYAIFTEPQSLIEPGPVGYVRAGCEGDAHRRMARILKIGLTLRVH
jgi:hypothetical protein